MSMQHWDREHSAPTAAGVRDAQDIAAALLLRQVEEMLRDGQPRHAIAHICDMTGVGRPEAEEFVTDLKNRLFSAEV